MSTTLLWPGTVPRFNVSVSRWILCLWRIGPLSGTWYASYAHETPRFLKTLFVASRLCRYPHVHRTLLPRLHTLQYQQMVPRLSPTPTPCIVLAQDQGHRNQHTLLVPTAPLAHEA